MSTPRPRPHGDSFLELEVAQLRAQVAALTELLIECGVVDRSMLEGRLNGAAARIVPRPLGAAPKKKPGLLARLFAKPAAAPKPRPTDGVVRQPQAPDETIPNVNLPFKPVALYGEPDRSTPVRLTPTDVGKCERCWRIRPLAANRLCFRCGG